MGVGKDVWTEKRAAGAARKRVPETPGAAVRCSQVSLPLYHFVARRFSIQDFHCAVEIGL